MSKLGKQILIFTAEDQACVADVHVEDLLKFRVDVLLLMSANLSPELIERCKAAVINLFDVQFPFLSHPKFVRSKHRR